MHVTSFMLLASSFFLIICKRTDFVIRRISNRSRPTDEIRLVRARMVRG